MIMKNAIPFRLPRRHNKFDFVLHHKKYKILRILKHDAFLRCEEYTFALMIVSNCFSCVCKDGHENNDETEDEGDLSYFW